MHRHTQKHINKLTLGTDFPQCSDIAFFHYEITECHIKRVAQ